MAGALWDLTALFNAADARAPQAERHLWLVRLTEWLRHAPHSATAPEIRAATAAEPAARPQGQPMADASPAREARTPLPVLRLRHLLNQLEKQPALMAQVQGMLQAFWAEIDAAALFADFGFGARSSLRGEFFSRLQRRWPLLRRPSPRWNTDLRQEHRAAVPPRDHGPPVGRRTPP